MATTHTMVPLQYYIVDGSNAPIGLTNGGPKGPTPMLAGVLPKLRKVGTDYEVLWTPTSGKI